MRLTVVRRGTFGWPPNGAPCAFPVFARARDLPEVRAAGVGNQKFGTLTGVRLGSQGRRDHAIRGVFATAHLERTLDL
jgi:hypothetical protein